MRKSIFWSLVAIVYATLFCFVFFIINTRCYHIFQQQSFWLTSDFFWSKVQNPGGFALYVSLFIEQFLQFRFLGALLLVAETFLSAYLCVRFVRKALSIQNRNSELIIWMLPVAISVIAWVDVKFPFSINMQVLLLAAVLNVLQIFDGKKIRQYLTPVFALLLYHACGPVVLYIFALCNIIQCAFKPQRQNVVNAISALAVSLIYPLLVYKFILPLKPNVAFYSFVPQLLMFTTFKGTPEMVLPFAYLPLAMIVSIIFSKTSSSKKQLMGSLASVVILAAVASLLSVRHDKRAERIGFKMEVAAFDSDWNRVIKYVKDNPWLKEYENYDRMVNFYYNYALANKGQLGDKIFTFPQRLGVQALFLDKPTATNVCLPLANFYYNLGFITAALHYAFEAQTTYNESQYLMKCVIDCLIVIGDYNSANIFLNKYEGCMFAGKYIADRRAFIEEKPNTELDLNYVTQIRKNHPKVDFYTSWAQNNMLQIYIANKDNFVASQYLLCSALLQKDLDLFADMVLSGYGNVSLESMPRAYQEAFILYKAMNKEVKPGTEKVKFLPYIFEQFVALRDLIQSNNLNKSETIMSKYPNTYWRYFFIDDPEQTGLKLVEN